MNYSFINTSVVILASSHNPTLLSEGFLQRTNIITKDNPIKPETIIVSPPFSQVQFQNGTILTIEIERLKIEAPGIQRDPIDIGQIYINELPHIKCIAIGINYTISLQDKKIDNFFRNIFAPSNADVKAIKYVLKNTKWICNIEVQYEAEEKSLIIFNFHYTIKDKVFQQLSINLLSEWEKNQVELDKFISTLFN